MKKMIALLAGVLFVGSLALAVDAENNETNKMDVSKNPITGTKTITKKHKKKIKDQNGESADVSVTDKTKVMKDGTVKTSKDVDANATEKH
jgi:hypothetical protein